MPAKTFFLGEYAAMLGAPAILLTSTPCFEMTLTSTPGLQGIHPDSPAGRFWQTAAVVDKGLSWHDPYHGCGGLGASSAQFLGAYCAIRSLQSSEPVQTIALDSLLQCYAQWAWNGCGQPPSGYDVWAQSLQGCVYLHRQSIKTKQGENASYHAHCYNWPFHDIAFMLVHTGKKLATHQHLQSFDGSIPITPLVDIIESAHAAFESSDTELVIDAVNQYHQALLRLGLVAQHSLDLMHALRVCDDVLAVKGCGAMGADVLLLLVRADQIACVTAQIQNMGLLVLATTKDLYG